MNKCVIINQLRSGGIYETAVSYCTTHGMDVSPRVTTSQCSADMCVVGMAEQAARDVVADVSGKLDRILAALDRIERKEPDIYCQGHPFAHSMVDANGYCEHCKKPAPGWGRTTIGATIGTAFATTREPEV